MIKMMYKPTNNVFTLPDEEALRIKSEDRANDYVILDAGMQEEKIETVTTDEAKKLEEDLAKQIEADKEAEKKKEEKQAKKEAKALKQKTYGVDDIEELKKMNNMELVALASKLGIRNMENTKNEEIIEYIIGNKKKVLKKPGSGRTRK